MSREKLPEAPDRYDKADQDRTRRLIERALSQPAAAGTINVTQIQQSVLAVARTQLVKVTGTITNGSSETGSIDLLTPSKKLIAFQADKACWLRLYSNQASSDNDVTRPRNTDPFAGKGVIGEFIITTPLVNVKLQVAPVIVLYNGDSPVASTIKYRITNDSGADAVITLTMTVVEMETKL